MSNEWKNDGMDAPKVYPPKIGFWRDRNNNFRSSVKGLTEEQVQMLKEFKVGDQLVIFQVEAAAGNDSIPVLELKKAVHRPMV